jgi:hypothetical protein
MVESSSESVAGDNYMYMYVCQPCRGACWLPVVHKAICSRREHAIKQSVSQPATKQAGSHQHQPPHAATSRSPASPASQASQPLLPGYGLSTGSLARSSGLSPVSVMCATCMHLELAT